MDLSESIVSNKRNGNLHVTVSGRFDQKRVSEVGQHICRVYGGTGNIFIHTHEITEVAPNSRTMFSSMLGELSLPKKNIYLMGEQGKHICHEEGRVIIKQSKPSSGGCGGRCKNCKCKTREKGKA